MLYEGWRKLADIAEPLFDEIKNMTVFSGEPKINFRYLICELILSNLLEKFLAENGIIHTIVQNKFR
jgi:hypothetical protein